MMKPPSNSPWDLSTLYDTIGSSNNDFGGFLGSSQTLQQTLDAFNGFSSQTQPPPPQQQPPPVGGPPNADYMSNLTSPAMGMTPNVTLSKSDYGDYSPKMMAKPASHFSEIRGYEKAATPNHFGKLDFSNMRK